MQEHLIPQDITNYRFHLIGKLDVQQFVQVVIGVGLAFIINKTGWPGIVRWPLMVLSAGTGIIAAFVPIADRPLSYWIKVFIQGIYAPTRFYWHKQSTIPSFFEFTINPLYAKNPLNEEVIQATPAKTYQVRNYFDTLNQKAEPEVDHLEIFNQESLQQALKNFPTLTETKKQVAYTPSKIAPTVTTATTKVVSDKNERVIPAAPSATATTPTTSEPVKVIRKPQLKTNQVQRARKIVAPSNEDIEAFLNNNSIFKPTDAKTVITDAAPVNVNLTEKEITQTQPSPAPSAPPQQQAPPIITDVSPSVAKSPIIQTPPVNNPPTVAPAPTPLSTTKTTTISGRAVGANNQPLADAIINIKDINGNPKAFLHTDEKGDFADTNALDPGEYIVSGQKDELSLPESTVVVSEDGVAPILLVAQ